MTYSSVLHETAEHVFLSSRLLGLERVGRTELRSVHLFHGRVVCDYLSICCDVVVRLHLEFSDVNIVNKLVCDRPCYLLPCS